MKNKEPKKEQKPKSVPNCIYAQAQFMWYHTRPSGFVESGGKREVCDLRGYWALMGIQCHALPLPNDDHYPIFWCENQAKCKHKVEGEPKSPEYSYYETVHPQT